ncbi:MAG: hypothetical protein A2579_04665 [Lysobacterales bacterium RIFOXYD1_FULL_69_11]|nr:MAG: hypothetical protein A2190_07370 [Xanthomonadales bacterium RIFOXYA1_FULL_69_10]OHE88293.1 MAG: hypothetical protein A2579_04665 [Xanthomonadales bacterium RIFOXYD1_FULL_69_11]
MLRILTAALLALTLAACATSHILTGQPRAPIDPAQVRVYFDPPPAGYEEIALLETRSGAFTYGEQNKTDQVIEKLRVEAAKLGANGVLFQGTSDSWGGTGVSVGAGGGRFGGSSFSSGGVGVSVTPTQKYARGVAIFVANPPPLSTPAPAPGG